MGMLDNIKGKADDMGKLRDKYEKLRAKEQAGQLDDRGREQLNRLRARFEK